MNNAKWTIKYLLADQHIVLHSLKSGQITFRGGPQRPKSGRAAYAGSIKQSYGVFGNGGSIGVTAVFVITRN